MFQVLIGFFIFINILETFKFFRLFVLAYRNVLSLLKTD